MTIADPVKAKVAAHWNRRAAKFDMDFGHSIATPAERAAWDRILDLVTDGGAGLDALDCGCGTGFLSFELAARGHRVTGIDFAPAMLAAAQVKAVENGATVAFEQGDAEKLRFPDKSFDLAVSRHVLWTLPHPEAAIAEWVRLLRPGGRVAVIDSQFDPAALVNPAQNARSSAEYADIGDKLPFIGGRPPADIEALFARNGLVQIGHDPIADLVEAHYERMKLEGMPPQRRRRYVAWGRVPR
ncbi:MAG TPA: methyltransferase domain-containing protein [Stellaceae bacterium]|jgi:ubiquinone/menaquinone biosynthesis C-methylase UbiE